MKYLLTFAAPALIALCFVGLVAGQSPPATPTGVIVHPSGLGVTISWDSNDAVAHWVAWMNQDEYQAASDAGDWTTALKYAYVPTGDTHVVAEGLVAGDDYWFIVGSADRQNSSAVAWGAWESVTAIGPIDVDDDAITRAYVTNAIAYYDKHGREAAFAYYNSRESFEGERSMLIYEPDTLTVRVYPVFLDLVGSYFTPNSEFGGILARLYQSVIEEDGWIEFQTFNPVTQRSEPKRNWGVLHDGLIFTSGHFTLRENIEQATKNYVDKATRYYDTNGLEATIAHYNSRDSLENFFYLFLMDENDIYLAHPIREDLRGTDIKDVTGTDFEGNYYELGKDIARATEEGHWVEYIWLNPVSGREGPKTTWAIRYKGLIFASGYYTPQSTQDRPWLGADPHEFTVGYVNRAIERYKDAPEAMLEYYNSVASYEGEWYLFATDENDIYIIHPLLPHLIGTDIKDVKDPLTGYELGKALAAATDQQGVTVEYDWPHPATGYPAPKISYAIRHNGMLFASGYYPAPADQPAFAKDFVQDAIDLYDRKGLSAVVDAYGAGQNSGGLWFLYLVDENDAFSVMGFAPGLVGTDFKNLQFIDFDGNPVGVEALKTEEGEGRWVNFHWPVTGAQNFVAHLWVQRHNGLLFGTAYFDTLPDVPDAAKTDDQLTQEYVTDAIAYYKANGRDATIDYYSLVTQDRGVPSLGPDERYLFLVDRETYVLLASPIPYLNNQVMGLIAPGGPFHAQAAQADENGIWVQSLRPNVRTGQQEPVRYFIVLHDGLLFMTSHGIIQENAEAATREYVNKAISFYDQYGERATVHYYNSRASLEGQFYLFMMDENDIYIVHPIESERIGTDVKDVTDDAGDPLGRRIAQATEEGVWVEYYWPHPVTGEKELKTTWAIRHDGKIFASGYYTASPAWVGEDPWEFTQDYVRRAIARYSNDGLESMQNYYNSVVSFEGQWYLFATDENDSYIVHPIFPNLIGTDIKALPGKDSAGNPLGESLAKAVDGGEGIRVEYQWPHPITLVEAPKIAYAVRRDGILFASGYYPLPEDPRTYTQNYVAEAIAYYEEHGLAATVEHYQSEESVAEGVWFLALLDKDGKFLTHYVNPGLVGTDAEDYWSPDGTDVGRRMLESTEEGHWFQATFPNVRGAGDNHRITWAIRHDGLIFTSGYFGAPTDDPTGH